MKRGNNNYYKQSDNLDNIDLQSQCKRYEQLDERRLLQQSNEKGLNSQNNDQMPQDQELFSSWVQEQEGYPSQRAIHQNNLAQSKPVSRLKILRMKFQNTQMAFTGPKQPTQNFSETVTDGLLRTERPTTKQQPRLINRNLRNAPNNFHEEELKISQNNQRAQLNKMIEMAIRKADRTRPPTSKGIRAKSQSIKVEVQDEEEFLGCQPDIPELLRKIPVKEMYKDKKVGKVTIGSRHRSVELDKIIRLNSRTKTRAGEPKKVTFKTSIEQDFLNLFAKDH